MNERTGIAVAGTLLVDKLYEIDAYPAAGELTKIKSISLSVGGLVPNNGIGLKRIDPQIPIFAIGRVGKDSEGDFALEVMEREGVDTSHIIRYDTERTGFTDVMSVSGGQRTFFTHAGGGRELRLRRYSVGRSALPYAPPRLFFTPGSCRCGRWGQNPPKSKGAGDHDLY
jgi:sugar/nucleoside kinase (ribokinase family)